MELLAWGKIACQGRRRVGLATLVAGEDDDESGVDCGAIGRRQLELRARYAKDNKK
jgi:hypothetical protein